MTRRTAQSSTRKRCRTLRSLSQMALRQRQVRCWTKDFWRKRGQKRCSNREMKCMQPCSTQPAFTAWWKNGKTVKSSSRSQKKSENSWIRKSEEAKHRTERHADAHKFRCMRCGRGNKYMKIKGKRTGPKYLQTFLGKWVKRHLGGHDLVRKVDRQGEVLIWCRKCSGCARQRMGPKLLTCCKPEQVSTKVPGKVKPN